MGARDVGAWAGQQKLLRKTPFESNPSPDMDYLPRSFYRSYLSVTAEFNPFWGSFYHFCVFLE